MADGLPPPSDSEILAHDAWVRRVVRRLVKDPHVADDLAQEAHEAHLRGGGSDVRETRKWLGGVVRNRLRQHLRSRARRERTEARAGRPRSSPAAGELVARAEVLRIVGRAVLDLPEPYRSVLLLRFHEDWPPRRIAAARGVSAKTVDNQIQAGLRMLRPRLEQRLGESWMSALLPVAYPLGAGPGVLAPLIVMSKPVLTTLAVATVLAAAFLLWQPEEGTPSPDPLAQAPDAAATTDSSDVQTPVASAAGGIHREDTQEAGAAVAPLVAVTVVDDKSAPVEGVEVALRAFAGYDEAAPVIVETTSVTGPSGVAGFDIAALKDTALVVAEIRSAAYTGSERRELHVGGLDHPVGYRIGVRAIDTTVAGTVLDPDGEPVAGARVWSSTGETRSAQDGTWKLETHSVGWDGFSAVAEGFGYAGVTIDWEDWDGAPLEIRLNRECVIRGTVRDQAGQPIVGVEVSENRWLVTRTDAQGKYELRHLPRPERGEGRRTLYARGDGWASDRCTIAIGTEGDLTQDFVLVPGVRVVGRIDGPGGEPVEGATVRLRGWGAQFFNLDTYSRADGSFAFDSVAPCTTTLVLERKGFAPKLEPLTVPGGRSLHDLGVLRLDEGWSLEGRVTDASGSPVEGAVISPEDPAGERLTGDHTDESGRFLLQDLPQGEIALSVRALGLAPAKVTVDKTTEQPIEITLDRAASFAGRVVDASTGEPIPDFVVKLLPLQDVFRTRQQGTIPYEIRTAGRRFEGAEDGAWRIEGGFMEGQLVDLEVTASGFGAAVLRDVPCVVDASPEGLVIPLSAGVDLRGLLVAQEDNIVPVAGARVTLHSEHAFTTPFAVQRANLDEVTSDAEGKFLMRGLAPGNYFLVMHADGRAPAVEGPITLRENDGEKSITIALPRGATITGRALDRDGQPWKGAVVEFAAIDANPAVAQIGTSEIGPDGTFRIDGVRAWTYTLRVRCHAQGTNWFPVQRHVVVQENEEVFVDLQPTGDCRVTGVLEGIDPMPAVLAVSVYRPGTYVHPVYGPLETSIACSGALAIDGRFEIDGLEPGIYSFAAYETRPTQYEIRGGIQDVTIREGASVELTIPLTRKDLTSDGRR